MRTLIITLILLNLAVISFSQTIELEIPTVFRSLCIFAEVAKSESEYFAPDEDSEVYAFSKLTEHYSEYEESQLLVILLLAEEREQQALSEFSLALLYMSAASEDRLPTIPEIKAELLPGEAEGLETLCVNLQDYPGRGFESAATKISSLCPLSKGDLVQVIDAVLNIFKDQYTHLGNNYRTGGYFHMAFERINKIFEPQRHEVRDILHEKLEGNRPDLIATSAFLLALYGDRSSIPYLEIALRRFSDDRNYQILVESALEMLNEEYASTYGLHI